MVQLQRLSFILLIFVLGACSTYQSKIQGSRNDLKSGQVQAALDQLKPLAEKDSDDQLVYLLDYGTALQIAGKYKESSDVFLKADKMVELNDYHSVSKIAVATLGSEDMVQYKGESYEKILISAYLAMDYLMMGQFDDAMVEVRRVNEKISKIRQDGRKNYELNPYANYLAGLIWESDGKFDDAYISYVDSSKIDSSNPFLPEDLIRTARKSRRTDDYQALKKQYPQVVENPDWYDKNKGEVVILVQQGWGPEKHFSPVDNRWPKLYPVFSSTNSTKMTIDGVGDFHSKMVYNVEQVVIKTLDDDVGWMIARKVGATVAKAVVADQIRQKQGELAGFLAAVAMRVSDRADLRQWSTLPKNFQMIRTWLPAGEYTMTLQGTNGGNPTADRWENVKFTIHPGHKTFLSWRSLR